MAISARWLAFALGLYKKNLAWTPYLGGCLLAWGHAAIVRLNRETGLAGAGVGVLALTAAALVAGYTLIAAHLWLCVRGDDKPKARFALVYAVVLVLLALVGIEWLLPTTKHYSALQINIQRQLKRRMKPQALEYRGLSTQMPCSYLGWADRERSFTKGTGGRVVFIGDSFLEMRSQQQLSTRVEKIATATSGPIEVVNLSISASNPELDYRYKLHEFAFDYQPDHIFVFVYELNDVTPGYVYKPYRHPTYRVSDEAVDFLKEALARDDLSATLTRLDREQRLFQDKAGLLAFLEPLGLSQIDQNLVYLACLGYSDHASASAKQTRLLPKTRQRFDRLVGVSIDSLRRLFGQGRRPVSLGKITTQYKSILQLDIPPDQRLQRIARIVGQTHCGHDDYQPFIDALMAQSESFMSEFLAYPDGPYYMAPALIGSVTGYRGQRQVDQARVEKTVGQYLKLFGEFRQLAQQHGVPLTIVLIPDCHRVDQAFLEFWRPMTDFRGYFPFELRRAQFDRLRQRLPDVLTTIDLTEHADQLTGAYWVFDGHWNPKGNGVVAQIISDHLVSVNATTTP